LQQTPAAITVPRARTVSQAAGAADLYRSAGEVVAIIRNAVALWPVSAVLLYWLGDFNTYANIDGREYVIARPAPARRLAYSVGLGVACGVAAGAAVWAVGRNWWARWMALFVVFTAALYVAADLNMYVVGFGPEGQDWVKYRPAWGAERLLECGVLGGMVGAVRCVVLWVVAAAQGSQPGGRSPAEQAVAPDGAGRPGS
jgi:hypothetical protein